MIIVKIKLIIAPISSQEKRILKKFFFIKTSYKTIIPPQAKAIFIGILVTLKVLGIK